MSEEKKSPKPSGISLENFNIYFLIKIQKKSNVTTCDLITNQVYYINTRKEQEQKKKNRTFYFKHISKIGTSRKKENEVK